MIVKNRMELKFKAELHEMLDLALEIQNLGIGTVFYNLSGHISMIEIDCHLYSWDANGSRRENTKQCFNSYIGVNDGQTNKGIRDIINSIKDHINKYKEYSQEELYAIVNKETIDDKKRLFDQLKKELNES